MKNNMTINDHISLLKELGQEKYNKAILDKINALSDCNGVGSIPSDFDGIAYGLKQNYSLKGENINASTNVLNSYICPYDSTVARKLKDAGFKVPLITNMDELAMGGTGIYSKNGPVCNSIDKELISGGSSSGSAFVVGSGIVPFAIGSDTGDSVIAPAAYNQIIGYKPTWGSVSRYGLYDFSPSFDHVAWFSNNVDDAKFIANILFDNDSKDQTSIENKFGAKGKIDFDISKIKNVNILSNIDLESTKKEIKDAFLNTTMLLKNNNINIINKEFDTNLLKTIPFIYQIITYSESLSSNSNLSGIPFGQRKDGKDYKEITKLSRDFNINTKNRFLLGMHSMYGDNMDNIFLYAKKLRTLFIEEFNKYLGDNEVMIFPTIKNDPVKIKDAVSKKISQTNFNWENEVNQIANITGSPSITIPIGKQDRDFASITIIAKPNQDDILLSVAKRIEELINE